MGAPEQSQAAQDGPSTAVQILIALHAAAFFFVFGVSLYFCVTGRVPAWLQSPEDKRKQEVKEALATGDETALLTSLRKRRPKREDI